MLLEIPTENEFADNIVAFWRPDAPLGPGAHRFDYDLNWLPPGADALPEAGYPVQVVHMASGVEPNSGTARLFVLDLDGAVGAQTRPEIEAGPGVLISGVALYPLPDDGPARHRLSFLLTPDEATDSAELRLRLSGRDGNLLAPLWLYRWTRRRDGGV
jgi:glucans biosynthesis protein